MSTARGEEAVKRWERGSTDKMTFMTSWQQIANYHLPNRSDYLVEKWPGQKRMTYIYDAFPVWCLEQHAAGIHSLLTSNALQWAWLRTYDERLNNDDAARAWLDDASTVMYNIFSGPRYNFASQSYEMWLDTGSIGCATMGILDGWRGSTDVLFSTRHMRECVWFENEEDRIDGLDREWDWTAKQAVQAWGPDRCGAKVRDAYKAGNETAKFKFLHQVMPRLDRDPQRSDKKNMPFESLYISVADKEEIAEGGFDEFPYLCPRYSKCSGETYGRGQAGIAQPDTQMLNELVKLVLKSAQKVIDPPLEYPDDGYLMSIKTVPGSLNPRRSNMRPDDGIKPIETKGQVTLGIDMLNALRQQIARTFYVDMLHMPIDPNDPSSEGKGSTATYWLQRRDKEMMMISPMLSRMQAEALGPAIDRLFAMLWRKSKARKFGAGSPFKPPPASLSGVPLRVEYVSPLMLAQKSTQMDGVTRLLAIQQQLKVMDPNSAMIVDGEGILRLAGRDFNTPVAVLKTRGQLQAEADQKAQAEAAMQNHTALANLAGAAKDGTGAIKNLADAQNAGGDQPMQEAA